MVSDTILSATFNNIYRGDKGYCGSNYKGIYLSSTDLSNIISNNYPLSIVVGTYKLNTPSYIKSVTPLNKAQTIHNLNDLDKYVYEIHKNNILHR